MEKMNCLVVEDEPLAAEVLKDYIDQVPFLQCHHICRDGIYAMQVLQEEHIDVLFLDIHLPRIKGLDFLKTLKAPPQVIITTAYREYAIDGYELNVVDYLLKPIHFNRFLSAVNKLKNNLHKDTASYPFPAVATAPPHLLVNVNRKKVKIFLEDILYIESRKEYICIVTTEQSFTTKITLTEILLQLPKEDFLRIHRSFVAARKRITAYTAVTVEIKGMTIPVGRSYRETVQQSLPGK